MQKNDVYQIKIESISEDGNGIGKIPGDGRVVFCRGALPGETVYAQIIKVTKSYAVARTCDITESSPDRISPDCEVFGKCGGCSFRHYSYSAQLKSKEQHVRDCIERIGGFGANGEYSDKKIEFLPIIGMEKPENYRNKAIFPFGMSTQTEDIPSKAICGFYRKNSHSIIEVPSCRLENDLTEKIRISVLDFVQKHNISIYDETTGNGLLRSLMVRTSRKTNTAMAVLVLTDKFTLAEEFIAQLTFDCPFVASIYININKARDNVIMSNKFIHIYGEKTLQDSILGTDFDISPMSFYQVNPIQTEKLYGTAIDFAYIQDGEKLLDIYCGIGTIGLCMANHAQKIGKPLQSLVGIEYVEQAIIDARHNAKLNSIENTDFYAGDAGEVLTRLTETGTIDNNFDIVVLDPPRKGCDEKLLDTAVSVNPKKIVYVSCNPATLARDLKYLAQKGYMPKRVQPVDMFPFTGHCECVVEIHQSN